MLLFQLELRWHKNALRTLSTQWQTAQAFASPLSFWRQNRTTPFSHFPFGPSGRARVLWCGKLDGNFPSSTTRCRRRHFFLMRATPPRDLFQREECKKQALLFFDNHLLMVPGAKSSPRGADTIWPSALTILAPSKHSTPLFPSTPC